MAEPPDPNQMFTVLISTRSFLKFLNSHVVSTTTIACEWIPFQKYVYNLFIPYLNCSPFLFPYRSMSAPLSYPLCLYRRCSRRRRGVDVLYPGDNWWWRSIRFFFVVLFLVWGRMLWLVIILATLGLIIIIHPCSSPFSQFLSSRVHGITRAPILFPM